MTYESQGHRGGEVQTQPAPQLNLLDLNSNRNFNRNDNANSNRNDNVNNNRNDNINSNRNDNTLINAPRQDVRVNTGPNTSDSRSNAVSGSNSSADARGGNAQINDNRSENVKYYGGSATAPNVYASGFCSEGGSTGVYVLGFGVSGGKTTLNQECLKKEDFQRTMQQVCKASDEHAMVALQSFQLELQAGNQLGTNPYAPGVGAGARRIANAKAEVSLQLDSVCSTLANSADATMDSMKKLGLDKPIIIPGQASNAAEQRMLDEAVAQKLEEFNNRVTKVEQRSTEVNVTTINVLPEPPKPVHRPQPAKPKPVTPAAEDCPPGAKKK
ncbi:MAG: hypothetical protein DKT66_16470 [Candidatus Melainabacteria bacterium]|nr:MAG: hypothetical protein DKT66_16470 [Candidatus Melainabacteria bacterium]